MRHTAWRTGRELSPALKESACCATWCRTRHVVSAEELLDHVWDGNADPFTQRRPSDRGHGCGARTHDGEEPLLETVIGAAVGSGRGHDHHPRQLALGPSWAHTLRFRLAPRRGLGADRQSLSHLSTTVGSDLLIVPTGGTRSLWER